MARSVAAQDLYARQLVGWGRPEKPVGERRFGLREKWRGSGPAISLGSSGAVCESFISPAVVALSYAPEHESPGKLLEQRADGTSDPELEN